MKAFSKSGPVAFSNLEVRVGVVWMLLVIVAGPIVVYYAPKLKLAFYISDEIQKIDVIQETLRNTGGREKICAKDAKMVGVANIVLSSWNKPVSVDCSGTNVRLSYSLYDPICTVFATALRHRGSYVHIQGAPLDDVSTQCPKATIVSVDL